MTFLQVIPHSPFVINKECAQYPHFRHAAFMPAPEALYVRSTCPVNAFFACSMHAHRCPQYRAQLHSRYRPFGNRFKYDMSYIIRPTRALHTFHALLLRDLYTHAPCTTCELYTRFHASYTRSVNILFTNSVPTAIPKHPIHVTCTDSARTL